jgi:hypothetical protein
MRAASPVFLSVLPLAMLAQADRPVVRRAEPPLPSGTAGLTGTVLTEANVPVTGARLRLTAPAFQSQETMTDELGRFTFANVPRRFGRASRVRTRLLETVYGAKRPGLPPTPIRLRARQRLNVMIRMFRGAAVTGSVV